MYDYPKQSRLIPIAAFDLIKTWEGRRLEVYLCPAGYPTVGYGRRVDINPATKHMKVGDRITLETAERWLLEDIAKFMGGVEPLIKKQVYDKLSQNQLGAIISLCYNIGLGRFERSTLRGLLNHKPWQTDDGERRTLEIHWRGFNKARRTPDSQPEILGGLVRRRDDEWRTFCKPDSENKFGGKV